MGTMRGSKGKGRAAASTFAVVACLARIAAAQGPTKAQCIEANTRGQDLRRQSHGEKKTPAHRRDAECTARVSDNSAHDVSDSVDV